MLLKPSYETPVSTALSSNPGIFNGLARRPRLRRPIVMLGLVACFVALGPNPSSRGEEMTAESLLQSYVAKVNQKHAGVTRAINAFKQRNFEEARVQLETACKADPQLPPARLLLARMFYAAGQPQQARLELERVSRDDPTDPGPKLLNGEEALGAGRFSDAELAFRRANELAAKLKNEHRKQNVNARTRQGFASIAEAREDWDAATKLLQEMVDADPENLRTSIRLARAKFKKGDQDGALKLLQQLWEADKESIVRPEITAALLFNEAKDKKQAARLLKLAADRDPDKESTQIFVAQWALENGDLDYAQQCVDRAMLASKSSLQSRLLAALVARYRKENELAREMLESVHLESPRNLAAVIELAIVLSQIEGMEARSIQYARLATQLQPDLRQPEGRNAAIALAWLLFRFGGRPQALQVLQQTLAAGPISVESSYYAALIIMPDNPAGAKKLLSAAVDSGRTFPGSDNAKALLNSM